MSEVTIYTTPTCVYCNMAKEFFKKNNVEYKQIDVSTDSEKAQEMFTKSGQFGVPVIDIDGKIIIGFDKESIKEALGI
ncbi:MAG: glutathione S-transferase N-terminal domain-containing protein [archaeon]|nr:glutathione S-transferase N-terminal domain-containing protein [archaeon]